jgi:thioredoxin
MIRSKKNLFVLGIVGLLFVFVGCDPSGRVGTTTETSEESESQEVQPSTTKNPTPSSDDKSLVRFISSAQFIELVSDYHRAWQYKGNKPCVVDFYADWCPPCRMLDPIFKKMAEKYAGKVDFYKIDIDSNEVIVDAYQIMGIPTLFFCSSDGNMIRIAGALSEKQMAEHIEMIVSK